MAEYTSKHSGSTIDEGIDKALEAAKIEKGYLLNNVFYTTSEHSTVITADTKKLYIDLTLNNNKLYYYNNVDYVLLTGGGSGGGNVEDVQVNGASILSNAIANIIVDSALSGSSDNPVKNSVIYNAIEDLRANLANFRGNFATKALLDAYSGEVTDHDFAVVQSDETHSDQCSMYIYQTDTWEYKYKINDTPLSISQLAALNSGIDSTKVSKITTNETNIGNMTSLVGGESSLVEAVNDRILIAQGLANAGKQLIIDALGHVTLDPIKRTRSFETLTIDSVEDDFYVESITDGTNSIKFATSLTNPGKIYQSSDGGTTWYLPYSEWRA